MEINRHQIDTPYVAVPCCPIVELHVGLIRCNSNLSCARKSGRYLSLLTFHSHRNIEIVQNMNSPENTRADKKIKKSKELIEEINDKLILLEDEELDLPSKFDEANAELALESMKEIFDKYEENEEDIETLEEWIEETRTELKQRVALLHQKKEDNEKMDKYLSDLIDGDIIREYKKYREQE